MKRLIFCFDGTWNKIDAEHSTNVVIIAESVLPLTEDGTAQLIYYDEGVGTGRWDRIRGGVFGSGLVQNLADAYRFLIFNYTPGDEIYIFGFSRGAYTARSFAGLLSNCGILLRRDAGLVDSAIELYKTRKDTPECKKKLFEFRCKHSPHICLSADEDQLRLGHITNYIVGVTPLLRIKYLGVWDTVGALGIPARFSWAGLVNNKHLFHNTELSDFVESARHAVAIDERRVDFAPTLWTNLKNLNEKSGSQNDSDDAPYQQKWFPGTHSSVGGGGERRGLSDQALDWIADGARKVGLELDASEHSRIFELMPDYREYIENSEDPGMFYRVMNAVGGADRLPGPGSVNQVSISARRRWHEDPKNLKDKHQYRPATLSGVAKELEMLPLLPPVLKAPKDYKMYQVKRGDVLSRIAKDICGDPKAAAKIFEANRDKLDHPDRIYVGQVLRIPPP